MSRSRKFINSFFFSSWPSQFRNGGDSFGFGVVSIYLNSFGKFAFSGNLDTFFFFSLSTALRIQDGETYVVKIAPGSFSGNAQLGLPSNTGVMLVFSSLTGHYVVFFFLLFFSSPLSSPCWSSQPPCNSHCSHIYTTPDARVITSNPYLCLGFFCSAIFILHFYCPLLVSHSLGRLKSVLLDEGA